MARIAIRLMVAGALMVTIGACGSSDPAEPNPPGPPTKTEFKTFITTADFTGDIKGAGGRATGVASADAVCQADAGKPAGGGTYKAMLVDGVNRVACATTMCAGGVAEHVDWVFKPNGKYYQSNGTTLAFTANANGVFDFANAAAGVFGSGNRPYWTGLGEGTAAWRTIATELCGGGWASSVGIGDFGSTAFSGWGAIGGGAQLCDVRKHLVCVEQ